MVLIKPIVKQKRTKTMKKKVLFLMMTLYWASSMAQKAYLVSNNSQIPTGGLATIEFWIEGSIGTVDSIDFVVKDRTTGANIIIQGVLTIPHLFTVQPEQTTTYQLIYARNRYGEIDIDLDRDEVTIYVETNGVIVSFYPPDVCPDEEDVELMRYFSSNVVGQTWFEGPGVTTDSLHFRPSEVSQGAHYLTSHHVYGNVDYPTTSLLVVYEVPEVEIHGVPNIVYDNTEPFILIGVPSGGQFFQDSWDHGLVGMNTFNPLVAGPGDHYVYYKYTTENGCQKTDKRLISVSHYGTGLGENGENTFFYVYPNPTNWNLKISVPDDVNVDKIEVYNMMGSRIRVFGSQDQLDVQDLPAQTYIVILDLEQERIRIPFVKY